MYETTEYFRNKVQRDRPYATREVCITVIEHPLRRQVQADGRIRFWAIVPDLGNRALRVVTLSDGMTIHNAFFDRRFRP
jgi:hypothetical protein